MRAVACWCLKLEVAWVLLSIPFAFWRRLCRPGIASTWW
jgi:hypothetical protein